MDLVQNLFRTLMFFFDNIIYGIIPIVYKLLIYLSQIDIFSTDTGIGQLINQIYTLLGIFMLFKISFSILQYLIDPNSFSDSSKGFGKILKNTLIAIILLVMVPFIFSFAAKIQYIVVNSNILGNLILGSSTSSVTEVDITDLATLEPSDILQQTSGQVEENAKDLQFLMYGAFFSVNTDKITACEGTPIFGSVEMAQNPGCLDALAGYFESEPDISGNNVTLGSFFKYIDTENGLVDNRNFSHFDKLLWWSIDGEYAINYLPLISTAAGIYVIFLLITFCIDIALRAIKLCFLQMVAPISIVSYIDPKENMGNSKLRNWINECVKTYVSLFIRLAVIFFILRLVSIIASSVFSDDGFVSKLNADEYTIWIYLFLVLGAFMFAKQVPKLIESLFGWKGTGDLQLNPIKAITSNAAASGLIGGAVGAAGGLAANATNLGFNFANNVKKHGLGSTLFGTSKQDFKNAVAAQSTIGGKAKAVAAGIGKGGFTFFRGGFAGARSVAGGTVAGAVHTGMATKGGKIPEGIKSGHGKVITNREARDSRQKQSIGTRATNAVTQFAGTKNEFGDVGAANAQIRGIDERLQQNAQIQNQLREQYAEVLNKKGIKYSAVSNIDKGVFNYDAYKKSIENNGGTAVSQDDYNKMSYYDRYTAVQQDTPENPKLDLKAPNEKNDFNELMSIQDNIQQTIDTETSLKKEKNNLLDASGKKKDDKK